MTKDQIIYNLLQNFISNRKSYYIEAKYIKYFSDMNRASQIKIVLF